MKRASLVVAAAFTLAGCHSFRDDVMIICDAPDKIEVPADAKAGDKLAAIGEYLDQNVKTKEGRELMYEIASSNRGKRSKILRELTAKYGVMTCHLADMN